jgi:hypothetical protein
MRQRRLWPQKRAKGTEIYYTKVAKIAKPTNSIPAFALFATFV